MLGSGFDHKLWHQTDLFGPQVAQRISASAGDAGDMGSVPVLGRSSGVGNGNPLHYSCLDNSMPRGAYRLQSTGSQRAGYD